MRFVSGATTGYCALASRPSDPSCSKVDDARYGISHYQVDSVVCFVNTYLLNSNLSGG